MTIQKGAQGELLKTKMEKAEVEREKKILELRVEKLEKEVDVRREENGRLKAILEESIKEREGGMAYGATTAFSGRITSETKTHLDTQDLQKIQSNYSQSLSKLDKLIRDLKTIQTFETQ